MLTVEEVAGWPDRPLAQAARQARDNARTVRTEVAAARADLTGMARWRGRAHEAAGRRIAEEADHADEVSRVLAAFADAADEAGAELGEGRDRVLRLVAEESGLPVGERPRGVDADGPEPARGVRVAGALAELDALDRSRAARLARLVADLEAMVGGHVTVATDEGRRDPDAVVNRLVAMSPEQRRELMRRMSLGDVDRLVAANPQMLGRLDGVPFPVRIAANRRAIEEALEDEIRRGAGDGARARELRGMLGTVADPHRPGARVRRQFVSFANAGAGRSIEMFGRWGPDTRGAAVYVPGTGTSLETAAPNRTAAWNLANRSGGPVFLYMDGDFPQTLAAAVSPGFATSMAPGLVAFGQALDAEVADHVPGAATTYIGHSYGGAVVGTAEQLGLRADRVVYASASGTGVLPGGAQTWANPDAAQRFSVTPPGDPIHAAQSSGMHGGDPDTAPGVTRMDSGDYSNGERVRGSRGHGGYFDDPGSDAFRNMVAVIRGDPVTTYVPREGD
ncbi:hypothetical protein [Gordonia crocea]|uniref:Alpha/beta hydrolase n=1 Tax=Gordonia crocea TaxID=589162 RepID=A0A7M3SU35_9ACTN|nr:hypothetical protein [Gordonia crocea]GED96159.1 hypothetical protein nbrc107697_01980 [Gordonia crocea]